MKRHYDPKGMLMSFVGGGLVSDENIGRRIVERREMLFAIGDSDLFSFLGGLRNRWLRLSFTTDGTRDPAVTIPLTATLVAVMIDWNNRRFLLSFHDASFAAVPSGTETPFGGYLRVQVEIEPSTEAMGKELDARDAVIHDLLAQLRE